MMAAHSAGLASRAKRKRLRLTSLEGLSFLFMDQIAYSFNSFD
jgi:hypothetical protein